MATFDRLSAKSAGYTDQEINDYLAQIQANTPAPPNPTGYLKKKKEEKSPLASNPSAKIPVAPKKTSVAEIAKLPADASFSPEQDVRKSLSQKIGEGAIGIAQNIFKPAYEAAGKQQAAVQGNAENTKGSVRDSIRISAKNTAALAKNTILNPKLVALGASFGIPFGQGTNIATKAVLPGIATGGLQGASQGEKPSEIVGDAVLGGVTGGVLHGAGKVAQKTLNSGKNAVAEVAEKGAKKTALKGLKPTPSQQANFYKDTGEKLDDFVVKRNLGGANYKQIDDYVTPLQEQFDSVASNPNLVIENKAIIKSFDDQIAKLNDSVLPADKAKAKSLQGIRDNFISKYGNDAQTSASDLTLLRRDVDAGIKDFNLDPSVKGPLNLTRDILQNSIRDSADNAGITIEGKSLKELGRELSKLYKLQEVAERQQFNGGSNVPFGITQLLGGGIGGAVAGVPGIAAGMAATAIGNSPKAIQGASKVMSGGANALRTLPDIAPLGATSSQVVGQTAARMPGIVSELGEQAPGKQNYEQGAEAQDVFQDSPIIPQGGDGALPDIPEQEYITGFSPEELYQGYLQAQAAGDKANTAALRQMYNDEIDYQKTQASLVPNKKPLSGPNSKDLNKAQTALNAINRMEGILKSDPNVLVKRLNPLSQSGRQVGAEITSAIDLLGYFRTGATITPDQRKDYIYLFPTVTDSPETKKKKIDNLRAEFEGYVEGLQNAGGIVEEPPAQIEL